MRSPTSVSALAFLWLACMKENPSLIDAEQACSQLCNQRRACALPDGAEVEACVTTCRGYPTCPQEASAVGACVANAACDLLERCVDSALALCSHSYCDGGDDTCRFRCNEDTSQCPAGQYCVSGQCCDVDETEGTCLFHTPGARFSEQDLDDGVCYPDEC